MILDLPSHLGINAAGRMDNMRIGVECLLTDDWGEAHRLASKLNQLNQARRHVEMSMKDDAIAIVQSLSEFDETPPKGIVLYQDDWHQGVIGIVAGRLKEKLYRPSIVLHQQIPHWLASQMISKAQLVLLQAYIFVMSLKAWHWLILI